MSDIIEVHDLHKNFGHFTALDGLDLTVSEGEIHGFLGPNGAGKSTTIRILLGILRASSGKVALLGRDPWADAVALHSEIAYVPGDVTLWPSLSGGETIDLLARMRGGINEQRRTELIERFDLDPRKKARTYSKGNRQKVALISALASDVRLLLLDEPTSGLDPLMEQVFRECVAEANQRGTTVLLSSHILSEVEVLCDRVTIIRAGRTVESGSLADMRHLSRTSITAELLGNPGDLTRIPGVEDVELDGSRLRCQVEGEHLGELIRVLGDTGVRSLVSAPPTLEELFMRHYHVDGNDSRTAATHSGEKVRA
ncbi:ATP-binding cassette domain-containing protein [Nocardia sp. CWNU-33]|uniref:ABC transporter ATP-binding protein n=1 Tax=Nocardia sp. CWNU-33 TaxID=3392117 RepID=UPI00398E7A6C